MRNTIYVVEFEGNKFLNGEFDFKDEAIAWAEDHISEKPIVTALDVEIDEDTYMNKVLNREEIFHYPVEEVKKDVDNIDKRLDDLEKTVTDEPEKPEEVKEDINSELSTFAANLDDSEEVKPEENLEEDVILFDPFGCDFSECEPMEVCADNHRADCCKDFRQSPADFLREIAADLGIADEVEISEKECADDSCEEKSEDEIPCENCEPEISEVSDEVKVDVAPEAEVAADPEAVIPAEVKANEEPNVEVQVEDEKPAEEISKCHVCPKCGKEICECGNKELVEKTKVTYTTGDPAIGDAHFNGAFEGGEGVSENLEENQVLTDFVQGEMAKGKSAEEVAGTDEFKELAKEEGKKDLAEAIPSDAEYEVNAKIDLVDDEAAKLEQEQAALNELEEESHPSEAQPKMDMAKRGEEAEKTAEVYGKKVIYGYFGPDHHGNKRYFDLDNIICKDDAEFEQKIKEIKKKYGGKEDSKKIGIAAAYPSKPVSESFEDEMSDQELAERLYKALEEKNCKK